MGRDSIARVAHPVKKKKKEREREKERKKGRMHPLSQIPLSSQNMALLSKVLNDDVIICFAPMHSPYLL